MLPNLLSARLTRDGPALDDPAVLVKRRAAWQVRPRHEHGPRACHGLTACSAITTRRPPPGEERRPRARAEARPSLVLATISSSSQQSCRSNSSVSCLTERGRVGEGRLLRRPSQRQAASLTPPSRGGSRGRRRMQHVALCTARPGAPAERTRGRTEPQNRDCRRSPRSA